MEDLYQLKRAQLFLEKKQQIICEYFALEVTELCDA